MALITDPKLLPLQYRPEIDGLRALAVVPVIMFHADIEMFSGGFVGVDVFFVISGYLITGIIHQDIQQGTFSIIHFYERRVRRILPALLVVCLVSIPLAWAWMPPDEFVDFSQSLIAVSIFVSNVLFWTESGYFEASAELKPLLHTWSLAVEEQFYVFFPLLLLLIRRFRGANVCLPILFLTIVSFALMEWASKTQPTANFYLLPTRAWELGVGALLAITAPMWVDRAKGQIPQFASILGLCMISYSIFSFDRSIPFPSIWALLPVLGTALLIVFTAPLTIAHNILSLRPIVGLGLISYSTYLWHHPLFAFARIRSLDEISTFDYLTLMLTAIILACLTWYFIEQPFRNRRSFSRKQVFSGSAAVMISVIVFGFVGHYGDGLPGRHKDPVLVQGLKQQFSKNFGLNSVCKDEFNLSPKCRTAEKPEIVVWGDSYAMHLLDGIISSNPDVSVIQMTKSACAPFADLAPIKYPTNNENWAKGCLAFNNSVRGWIAGNDSVRFAVISSPLTALLPNNQKSGSGRGLVYDNGAVIEASFDLALTRFMSTLDWLSARNIKPVIFSPLPEDGRNVGTCLARSIWFDVDSKRCSISFTEYLRHRKAEISFLKHVEKKFPVIWFSDYLCNDEYCAVEELNVQLYRDAGHLSREGSRYIGRKMDFFGLITNPNASIADRGSTHR
ncbi:MAG: acyltransferase [Gammaproteobacteria bacterium]|nr:acyltransferase [Gammaproteobacteria bacterium]